MDGKDLPQLPWCRYADDGLVHCKSQGQAREVLAAVNKRFIDCGLTLHPDKTNLVYCKDSRRKGNYQTTSFDFLGYTFRPRRVKDTKNNRIFIGFNPAVSKSAKQAMKDKIRSYKWHRMTPLSIEQIAHVMNPILNGWLNYYGRYYRSELEGVWQHFNTVLVN